MRGKIIKSLAGFYYVYGYGDGRIYACRARGVFRKEGVKPCVGDDVSFTETEDTEIKDSGQVMRVLARKNFLLRPPVANIDQALLVFAAHTPEPNFLLADRFLLWLSLREIPCILIFNKCDLAAPKRREELAEIYRNAGTETFFVSARTGENIDALQRRLAGKTSALAGPSGVGKSSLVNLLCGETRMEVGELSKKTARGKQTTRHTELFPLKASPEGGFILDSAGFSSLDTPNLPKEALAAYYPEFSPYADTCRFAGCMHDKEPDCMVREAAQRGEISALRYANYLELYEELKQKKRY